MKRSSHLRAITIGLIGVSAFALAACQEEEKADAQLFPSLEACLAAAKAAPTSTDTAMSTPHADVVPAPAITAAECEDGFRAARANYIRTAPRYVDKALCEEEFGLGKCTPDPDYQTPEATQSGGSGSVFMPAMMGYMLGSMMSGGARQSLAPQPLFGSPGGAYVSGNGVSKFSGLSGRAAMPAEAFRSAPPVEREKPQASGGTYAGATSAKGGTGANVADPVKAGGAAPATGRAVPMTRATVKSTGGFGASRTSSFGGGKTSLGG